MPPLPVIGPTGEALVLRSLGRDDTVATLAARLGVEALRIDGRNLSYADRLVEIDQLRSGARLSAGLASGERAEPGVVEPVVDVRVVAGPCVSPWRALPPGRYFVGRARTVAIRLDDPGAAIPLLEAVIESGVAPLEVVEAATSMLTEATP